MALRPEQATYAGMPGHDDRWSDLGPQGAAATVDALRAMRRRIRALPAATDRWDRLAVDVALTEIDEELDWYERGEHERDLHSMASPLQTFRQVFDHAPRSTAADWENVAARLERLPVALDAYCAGLEAGLRRGAVVAARQVEEAIRQARVNASSDSPFVALTAAYRGGGLASRLDDAVDTARAAFAACAARLETGYLPHAAPGDAVGEERYAAAARRFLGTDLDLRATYAWGWDEIADLRRRMEETARHIVPGGGTGEALAVLSTDPARAAASPQEFRAFAQQRLDDALRLLDGTHFEVPAEIRRCEARLAPAGTPLGAYYVQPSEDFSRPGTVWWSFPPGDAPVPLYDEVSTIYHEGFPGHHLQGGVQLTVADRLSRLHRIWVWKSGSGEGWALYAERLMDELGHLDTPDYVFGYLAAQMLRACRVVIDIGSHLTLPIPTGQPFHPGETWTFDLAVEMLETHATLAPPNARSEALRYLGWPGQAISYKVGEREILRMRRAVEEREGAAFSAKRFHARLLEVGSIGIDLLERFVLPAA